MGIPRLLVPPEIPAQGRIPCALAGLRLQRRSTAWPCCSEECGRVSPVALGQCAGHRDLDPFACCRRAEVVASVALCRRAVAGYTGGNLGLGGQPVEELELGRRDDWLRWPRRSLVSRQPGLSRRGNP